MGDLTKDFSLYEFRQRSPLVQVPQALVPNVQRLANQLQKLRNVLGPITINSSYRTEAKNRAVGGASSSRHLTAAAADITVPARSNKLVYCTILGLIGSGAMMQGGLGWYGEKTASATRHVHYDADNGVARRWNKSTGLLPICSPVEIIEPIEIEEEEEDEMKPFLMKTADRDEVYWTDTGSRWWVTTKELVEELKFTGVRTNANGKPFEVRQEFINAIPEEGTLILTGTFEGELK